MRVTLLGPVAAAAGEVELALGGLKQRAVFALMALNAGRVVPLDRLVDELWSEEPPARATLSLQSYVARLRRMLSALPVVKGDAPRILTRPPGWVLTVEPEQVDVTRFDQLITQARRALAADGVGAALAAPLLEQALALWTGEPLAGLEMLRFAREEATRLRELHLDATELLLQAHLDLGESVSVAELASRFVSAYPFRERAWCALMLALYRSGRQSEALAAAAALRRTLDTELGVSPSPEVRRLEEQILRQDEALSSPTARSTGRTAAPTTGRGRPADHDDAAGPRTPLVGRDDVLWLVDVAATRAEAGHGRLLVLDAPAGLGKSSILQALEDRVRAGDGAVMRGDCVAAGAAPALWPWVSVVRGSLGSPALPRQRHVEGDHDAQERGAAHAALALLESGTSPSTPSGVPVQGADPDRSRMRLFRRVIEAVAGARAAGPVVVVMDDLHWADADTLTLLSLAVVELVPRGVLFAVAIRSGEPGADAVLALLDRLGKPVVQRVPLAPLAVPDVAALVRSLSGSDADPAVVSVVRSRTAGNPLFVCELVRLLMSEHRLDADGVGEALPDEVRDVLRRRLDRLPQQTVAVLCVIAVAGGPATVDLLADVTGLDVDAVLDACEAAVLTGLLIDDVGHPGSFALSHDLVRQTLEQSVSTARRLRLHARIAQVLQAGGPLSPQQVVDVARHLTLAAPVVGPAAAVPHLVAACDDALSRYANDQAERHLRTALDLVAQVPGRAERGVLEGPVRARLRLLQLTVGGSRDAQSTAEQEAAPPTDAEATLGWLSNMIGATVTGHAPEAAAAAEAVLAGEALPVTQFSAHFVRGLAGHLMGRIAVSSQEFEAVEALAARGVDVTIPGFFAGGVVAAAASSLVAHIEGHEARADARLVIATERAAGSESALGVVTQYRVWLAAMRGDARQARQWAAECRSLARRLDYDQYATAGELVGGWADAMLGDGTGADRADAAYDRYLAAGLRMLVPLYLLLRAEAHAASGRTARARELIGDSRAVRAQTGEVCSSPRLLAWAAQVADDA